MGLAAGHGVKGASRGEVWLPGSAGVPPAEPRLRGSLPEAGLAGFSGFRFARPALFAATGNPGQGALKRFTVENAAGRIP